MQVGSPIALLKGHLLTSQTQELELRQHTPGTYFLNFSKLILVSCLLQYLPRDDTFAVAVIGTGPGMSTHPQHRIKTYLMDVIQIFKCTEESHYNIKHSTLSQKHDTAEEGLVG